MIPELPEGISDEALLQFYDTLNGNLSDQSTIHTNWFTHRRNPSVCWICDTQILITKVIELAGRYITKSTVDLETASLSEDEADSEIEESTELIPEPEYEVEDD